MGHTYEEQMILLLSHLIQLYSIRFRQKSILTSVRPPPFGTIFLLFPFNASHILGTAPSWSSIENISTVPIDTLCP